MIGFLKSIRRNNKALISYPITIFVSLLILEIVFRYPYQTEVELPAPSIVVMDLINVFDVYLQATFLTFLVIIGGLIPAVIAGWLFAVIVGECDLASFLLKPYLEMSQMLPKTALIPVFLVVPFLGYSYSSKILIVFLISFYPVFVDTLLGYKNIKSEYLRYFDALSVSPYKVFVYLKIPFTLHYTFNGLRTGTLYAIIGAVTAEILIGNNGLGYLIDYSASNLKFVRAMGGLFCCMFIGGLFMGLYNVLEGKFILLKNGAA